MEHHHYRVAISYNGCNYFGWQDLGDEQNKATVQGTITQALRKICKYADCIVSGASRTDAGVHAQGQVAKLSIPLKIGPGKLQLGLNSLLSEDIRILQCAHCRADFNPNRQSTSKKYRYYFSIDKTSSPILNGIVAHVPSKLEGARSNAQLDLESMRQACKLFVGEHDFYSFASRDQNIGSTIRTISHLDMKRTEALGLDVEVYCFEIEGNGFLKHMVRYIVGAIVEVGRHVVDSEDIRQALCNRNEKKFSPKAKARGLHLIGITY
ncbi:MAG: tRNA pseudouridine(38-40) synthase TruA [SAR86 cluster bacterium]|uniref:tRNA pseudouridine synthase A n=1 Tax=SAR86 cluster bacterium TaxID=2030880 RepID=A0A2A4WWH8_9GAMM|nr:MAG: tRNA pseudouridine(38-40) synthase TruA [SAR86 cluster bacterium]